jgi:transposase
MRIEARQHPVTRRLETIPGIGPIRAAQLVPIISDFRGARERHGDI